MSDDGAHLVVQDGFGLSRFTFGKGVKTDKSLSGQDLSVAGNRMLVRAARSHKRALRTVDAMFNERFAPSDYSSYAVHPDGVHVIDWAGDVVVHETETPKTIVHRWPRDLRSIGALDLGRSRPISRAMAGCAVVGPDATLAAFRAHTRSLAVARIVTEKKFEPLFCAEVAPPVGQIVLYPFAERTYFGAHDRATRRATLYSLTSEGVEHRWTIDARSRPVYGGGYWFWQRDEATVCRADWRELDRPERFEIPSEFRGEGDAIGHGDRVLFLPFDAERVVDLRKGKAIDRKLGAKEAPLRALVTDTARVFDAWLAEEGGAFAFGHLEQPKSLAHTVWSPRIDFGAATLSTMMAHGELIGRCSHNNKDSKLAVMSYESPMDMARVTLADVRRAFDACERYEALLLRSLSRMDYALKYAFEPAFAPEDRKAIAPQMLFDEDAATVVLRAIDETIRKKKPVALGANIDAWASRRWTPESLSELQFPADAWSGPAALMGAFELPMVVGYIALDLFGPRALAAFVRWFVTNPAPHAEANPHVASDVCARLIQHYPETEQPFRLACDAAGKHGQEMLRNLEFNLARRR
ncbi:MAG: hypothetical protein JNK05_35240 [Myxococcales bacterium]|nr:hypothetical protein [Myxococcales bacterium]